MKKMIIVSWFGAGNAGGVERVTKYMLRAWEKIYNIQIVDFETMRKHRLYKALLGKHYILDCLLTSVYVHKLIQKHGCSNTIIVTQGFNAPFIKADISYAHGTMRGLKIAYDGENAKWKFNQLFEKWAHKRAKKVIAVSRRVKEELMQYYGVRRENIEVIENCVNTNIFYPDMSKQNKANENNITCLFCGRISSEKGVNIILQLAQEMEQQSNMSLLIATPSYMEKEIFSSYKNTTVMSNLNENQLPNFYRQGDILIIPSQYEGFGLATIEGLSSGVPVIGYRTGVINELYECKIAGVHILEDSHIDINKIQDIAFAYKDEHMKMELHDFVAKKYSEEKYITKLQVLLDEK